MSSRVVLRDTLRENEVHPYSQVELRFLLPPYQERVEREEEEEQQGATVAPPPSEEEILAAARQRAEAIIMQAQHEAETLRYEAHAQGVTSGREEGREQARQELLPSLVAFAQAGQSLIVLEEHLIERFTPQLVRLALDIAERVVGKQVEGDPRIVASVLERARAELPQARFVRIWLHPLDHQTLVELRPDLVWVGEKGGRKVEVLSSEEIERGGCRVETEMGTVDATIPVQMQEIKRQMLD